MEEKFTWLTMSYSLPPSPSANRVYVWRKLKELGAYSRQGAALLPQSKTNQQRLQQLATRVRSMDGEATVAELRFVEEQDNRTMIENFKRQSEKEYHELIDDVMKLCEKSAHGSSRSIKKRIAMVGSRDFFGAREELGAQLSDSRLLAGLQLDLEGGLAELMNDLRQGYRDLSSIISQGGGTQGR